MSTHLSCMVLYIYIYNGAGIILTNDSIVTQRLGEIHVSGNQCQFIP
jgi:hypothetical protein